MTLILIIFGCIVGLIAYSTIAVAVYKGMEDTGDFRKAVSAVLGSLVVLGIWGIWLAWADITTCGEHGAHGHWSNQYFWSLLAGLFFAAVGVICSIAVSVTDSPDGSPKLVSAVLWPLSLPLNLVKYLGSPLFASGRAIETTAKFLWHGPTFIAKGPNVWGTYIANFVKENRNG